MKSTEQGPLRHDEEAGALLGGAGALSPPPAPAHRRLNLALGVAGKAALLLLALVGWVCLVGNVNVTLAPAAPATSIVVSETVNVPASMPASVASNAATLPSTPYRPSDFEQRWNEEGIERIQFDPEKHVLNLNGFTFGKEILVMPQKLGGGVTVTDLHTGRTLASIWYENYGDYDAIPHHIIAFPSEDPYQGFDILNSCQGGQNNLLYGIPRRPDAPEPYAAGNIYRLHFDGNTLSIEANVSDITGLGLGVHTTINPKDANSFAVSDGQKDIAAVFDRYTSKVIAAFRYDWAGRTPHNLKTNWINGGTMTIKRIYPDKKTGKFDLLGTKGNKIDFELVPMGEGDLENGLVPGASPATVTAADGWVFHPSGEYAVEIVRMLGGGVVHRRGDDDSWHPYTFVSFNAGTPDHAEVKQIDKHTWEITVEHVGSPGHELGFTPDGKRFMMMNNLRENSVGFVDSSDPDAKKWKKLGVVLDPAWEGKRYPNPFHMGFSHDSKKGFFVVLRPAPSKAAIMIVDMETMKIKKEIRNINPDIQSVVTSNDGKYVMFIMAGFQRYASGLLIMEIETEEIVGFLPAPGGHHDVALVPRTVADLKYTRAVMM